MATTTNFGWETPDDTDLVKDGAAAIRTALGGVDTSFVDLKGGTTGQVLAKASNTDLDFVWSADAAGMVNPMTTTGDTIYSSSGSTPARLGIGTTGQVLTVAGGLPSWATPTAGGTDGYTLLNAGGTALTGASQITVSGITSNDLLIFVTGASCGTANSLFSIKFNNSSTNHFASGLRIIAASSYAASNFDQLEEANGGRFPFAYGSSAVSRPAYGYLMVQACKSTSVKPVWFAGANDGGSGNGQWSYSGGGYFDAAAAITSVSVLSQAGNFNGGTLRVYGRA
jgi:hypothetical protein